MASLGSSCKGVVTPSHTGMGIDGVGHILPVNHKAVTLQSGGWSQQHAGGRSNLYSRSAMRQRQPM